MLKGRRAVNGQILIGNALNNVLDAAISGDLKIKYTAIATTQANGSILQKIVKSSIAIIESITVTLTNNTISISVNKAKVSLNIVGNSIITL